jgi:hypothetical protein
MTTGGISVTDVNQVHVIASLTIFQLNRTNSDRPWFAIGFRHVLAASITVNRLAISQVAVREQFFFIDEFLRIGLFADRDYNNDDRGGNNLACLSSGGRIDPWDIRVSY